MSSLQASSCARSRDLFRPPLLVGVTALCIALGFSLYTDHRWEDYYITFRAGKNLATGHGLVFEPGERVHTFTSPFGVLLPAVASWIVGPGHDEAALWLFRIVSIAAFAGAVVLSWLSARAWEWSPLACGFLSVWLMTDAKSVDFAINGMETAFLLFFLALTVYTLVSDPSRGGLCLGLAWAGLMWTRPDSLVYIGAIALGFWIFPNAQRMASNRRGLSGVFLHAGLICAAFYGPWLLWAWHYYGSPIPNTIVAKSLSIPHPGLSQLVKDFLLQPLQVRYLTPGDPTFAPSYYQLGGWSIWVIRWSRFCAWLALVACFIPGVRPGGRALSVAFFVSVFYLNHAPGYPWYRPPSTWLAVFAFVAVFESLLARSVARNAISLILWSAVGATTLGASLALLGCSAWQLRWQQEIVEGQRRAVGEWLRAHRATPHDTVYLEPLGYIGYFSQLKMLDHPGLASREVIAARRRLGHEWVPIIRELAPDWVVCRPFDPDTTDSARKAWFHDHYRLVKTFDVSPKIAALSFLPGRGYLEFDQQFRVFHRHEP